jgi:hypothetical protein
VISSVAHPTRKSVELETSGGINANHPDGVAKV